MREVRFRPDHKVIRKELLAHMEDGRADLERLGYDRELAEQRTLEAMGEAKEIGADLDRAHHPFWGRLWQFSRRLLAVLLITVLVILFRANGRVNDGFLRTAEQLRWTEPAAGADRAETKHAVLWLAPGEVTETDGVFQAELHLWIRMQDPFGYGPELLPYLEFSDDQGAVPPRTWTETGIWQPEVGYWKTVSSTDNSWTRYRWTFQLVLDHAPQWVELTYPYGGNSWTLRAEWEGSS